MNTATVSEIVGDALIPPRVCMIRAGGTIDSVGNGPFDVVEYAYTGRRLSMEQVVDLAPGLTRAATLCDVPFAQIGSSAVDGADWLRLASTVESALADHGAQGAIVLFGTNTLEETAYFLSLVLDTERPVVMAASIRPASAAGSDAPVNLMDAARIAVADEATNRGVLIPFDGTVHGARYLRKRRTCGVNAFDSDGAGPLGAVWPDGTVVIDRVPRHRHTAATPFHVSDLSALPEVTLVWSYAGSTGYLVDAAADAGARGIVVAGQGAGRCTPGEEQALDRAVAAGITVVRSTGLAGGPVVMRDDFRRRGMLVAYDLSPGKARILLTLALTLTSDPEKIEELLVWH